MFEVFIPMDVGCDGSMFPVRIGTSGPEVMEQMTLGIGADEK